MEIFYGIILLYEQWTISVIAESVWDPLSTTQTSRLVNVISKLGRDYPCIQANNKATQHLLNVIVRRIRKTLEDDVFMPLYPKSVLENRSSNASVFFHRQLWVCIKLLGNILSWHGILSNQMLRSLSLDGLLNRYIILGLCNSGVNKETIQKCQSIISTFPKEWFEDLEEDKTMPQLENLGRFLVSVARTLYSEGQQNKRDFDKKDSRDFIKQISKMLVNIHAMEYAVNLPMWAVNHTEVRINLQIKQTQQTQQAHRVKSPCLESPLSLQGYIQISQVLVDLLKHLQNTLLSGLASA